MFRKSHQNHNISLLYFLPSPFTGRKKGAAKTERRGGGGKGERERDKSGPLRDRVLAVQGNGDSADTLAAKW